MYSKSIENKRMMTQRGHCYVVVEVKVREFTPADIGQTGTYVEVVNDNLKQAMPTIEEIERCLRE